MAQLKHRSIREWMTDSTNRVDRILTLRIMYFRRTLWLSAGLGIGNISALINVATPPGERRGDIPPQLH